MKEALKLALEAAYLAGFNASGEGYNGEYPFEHKGKNCTDDPIWCKDRDNELAAIKQVFAAPVREPVAWGVFEGNLHDMFFSRTEADYMAYLKGAHAEVRPLYTTPPAAQRQWVGLTIGEIQDLIQFKEHSPFALAEDIEAKLKEKNT
jgi:hypothetical protein